MSVMKKENGQLEDFSNPLSIVDNLTSTEADRALSAKQGKVLKDAIDEINSKLFHLLWSNPDPTQSFATQNITLSSDDYDLLLFVFNLDITYPSNVSLFIKKGHGGLITYIGLSAGIVSYSRRSLTYVNDTKITVGTAWSTPMTTGAQVQADTGLIPIAIYGIKIVN